MAIKRAKKAPTTCEGCERWGAVKRRIRISELLAKAMKTLESKIQEKELKPTVGDYLKLLQMEQEFEQGTPKEIKVTWVEPGQASDGER
jgi:hypothetical protein